MKIDNLTKNYNTNFGTTWNKNLERVVDDLAQKGYSKLEQRHLNTLKILKNDGLKNVSLDLEYSVFGNTKLTISSQLVEDATNIIEEILIRIRKSSGVQDERIRGAMHFTAKEALKLCRMINTPRSAFVKNFISNGVNLSLEDKTHSFEENLKGLANIDVDYEKLLKFLEPRYKFSEKLLKFHKNLFLQIKRTKFAYDNFCSIANSN